MVGIVVSSFCVSRKALVFPFGVCLSPFLFLFLLFFCVYGMIYLTAKGSGRSIVTGLSSRLSQCTIHSHSN